MSVMWVLGGPVSLFVSNVDHAAKSVPSCPVLIPAQEPGWNNPSFPFLKKTPEESDDEIYPLVYSGFRLSSPRHLS